jgi:maltose O-acetyltransferase
MATAIASARTTTPACTTRGIRPLTQAELAEPDASALKQMVCYASETARWVSRVSLATSFLLPLGLRRSLLRLAGLRIGAKVTGLKQCGFETKHITIGDGSFINVGCWFEGAGTVNIGRDVFFGPQVMVITSVHEIDLDGTAARNPDASRVTIGDRCWIGARATILPGVAIGAGTIIGAGALVNKDCKPGAVYAGVPARQIR